ncbi:MAG: CPBP family intramembrane metalloprotease [Actinobacteria bacterium]|jgi:membrane protease YdiL (CAAX protease family)|nr:MAG: CPBP family intramembrane metalloprotease [Actinomycetota bacterium]
MNARNAIPNPYLPRRLFERLHLGSGRASLLRWLAGVLELRWRPSADLAAVAISWLLVVAALSSATFLVTAENGIAYFLLYAIVGATLAGVGIPLAWTTLVRRRPISDLGITSRRLAASLVLQAVFFAVQTQGAVSTLAFPGFERLLPLVALALAIGLFEAIFWRGWVQQRLEAAFGFVPALLAGSLLYAAYHIGYGMPFEEIVFLYVVGLVYGAVFRLTGSVFILWPFLQPSGQLLTLIRDGLALPPIAALGFVEVLAVMLALAWAAHRYHKRGEEGRTGRPSSTRGASARRRPSTFPNWSSWN